ncbi:GDSL family lipase [Verminephrobacter aporrectodeae subsp. tuberculatae]|uniref:GDSL family lipase n=1 Tax=Verminephrobacter aporrectodeae subsp. tuberculatae TaxID=1110392 RepID=A0ABT3KX93_9BURK|nr:SGNH/GDSL hydrolase family protein [Verminephrobacter aporrectodeae]MCW5221917.1 GDSL family lipase [Verminephrobacter aporrectodeae subsp. tuberculatae]MCW5291208.1 GDSL family lipase [Verminephrobacter aporrectodeae subsp. tuberculatae]MCW5322627.1 GDSL family lipase [Verminephrobacter aporrectodeae subsp. tuberculatae]MCW8166086.1 GDSL family lipase [Verminephrobacter aporrectodeae subsp. tuberculatae]MCW8170129.1 GDSL family lipase [Verminephrobacter aporrectodeae subsp. tuberculatae]
MAANWMRRSVMVAVCASAAWLTACGSSTTESAISPQRFVAFGDAMSDVGQNGPRYTVNDGSVNNWTLKLAAQYGKPLTPVAAGGRSYAVGNARIQAKPDAAGNANTRTLTEQIDDFLAGDRFAETDLVLVSGGISDVIAGMAAVTAGRETEDAMVVAARQAGNDMAAQVRRLVDAGAKHVVVTGTYDLSKTPWAKVLGREDLLTRASSRFNEGLLVDIVDLGANVLYVDSAYYVNLYTSVPGSYGFKNTTAAVCTAVDPANGIGIGAGQLNSTLCTGATLLAGANQDTYVFADTVYLTPSAQRQFGTFAYDRLRSRW